MKANVVPDLGAVFPGGYKQHLAGPVVVFIVISSHRLKSILTMVQMGKSSLIGFLEDFLGQVFRDTSVLQHTLNEESVA